MKLSTRFLSVAASTFLLTTTTSTLPKSIGFIHHRAEAQSVEQNQADQLFNEGMQFFEQGTAESYQLAIAKWQQALPLYEQQQDQAAVAGINVWIAFVSNKLGLQQQAITSYKQALSIYQAIGDRNGEATTLNNMATVYDELGEKQQALDLYQQALPLWRAMGAAEGTQRAREGEAHTLNNIGGIYGALGDKQQALDYFQQSLPLSRATGDRSQEAATLNNIGYTADAKTVCDNIVDDV